jgi:hypothetical protein
MRTPVSERAKGAAMGNKWVLVAGGVAVALVAVVIVVRFLLMVRDPDGADERYASDSAGSQFIAPALVVALLVVVAVMGINLFLQGLPWQVRSLPPNNNIPGLPTLGPTAPPAFATVTPSLGGP